MQSLSYEICFMDFKRELEILKMVKALKFQFYMFG